MSKKVPVQGKWRFLANIHHAHVSLALRTVLTLRIVGDYASLVLFLRVDMTPKVLKTFKASLKFQTLSQIYTTNLLFNWACSVYER